MISLFNGKRILGSWSWWLGERIITSATHYEGESLEDARYRAKESVEMLNRNNLPYFYQSIPKYYPLGK